MTTTHTPDSSGAETLAVLFRRLAAEAGRQSPVTVRETHPGRWDVVLRLDGTYSSREDAEHSARFILGALADAATHRPEMQTFDETRAAADPGSGIPDLIVGMHEAEKR